LPDPIQFRVYIPPCYNHQPDRYYPVLYLIHGQTYNDDQWDRLGVDEMADVLIASREISPLIIVMPREDERSTPPPENLFGDALIFDLLPFIDTEYRTIPDRQYRAIGGLSRGGNWAVHIGLSYWGFFGQIGAHSTPTFVTDGPAVIREWLAEIPADELPRISLDAGEDDIWLRFTLQFEKVLNQENIPHEWNLYSGQHDEEYWSSHIEQYLRWYTQDW
jgi:enterochelin esterase-like enzyme